MTKRTHLRYRIIVGLVLASLGAAGIVRAISLSLSALVAFIFCRIRSV